MSDYSHRPGGSLKFKGGAEKKKKKKSKSTAEPAITTASSSSTKERDRAGRDGSENRREGRHSRSASPAQRGEDGDRRDRGTERRRRDSDDEDDARGKRKEEITGTRGMTESEKRFLEVQRQRRAERVAKGAHMTHKDRVTEFNSKLDKLTYVFLISLQMLAGKKENS